MGRKWWATRRENEHLNEETLLLHLDGALGRGEEEDVAAHLRECWSCRAMRDRYEETIGAFMEERRIELRGGAQARLDTARLRTKMAAAARRRPPKRARAFPMRRALWPFAAVAAIAATGLWEPVAEYLTERTAQRTDVLRRPVPTIQAPAAGLASTPPKVKAPSQELKTPSVQAIRDLNVPSEAELDSAEAAAHVLVHDLGLCRWNSAEVRRMKGAGVVIRSVANDPKQAEELKQRAAAVKWLQAEVIVPEEQAANGEATGTELVLDPKPPMLEARLKEHFRRHSAADRAGRDLAEFSNEAVRLAREARVEAELLRVLARSFPEERLRGMRGEERQRLERLAADHWMELKARIAVASALMRKLEPGEWTQTMGSGELDAEGWHAWLERDTARLDELTQGLFAGLELKGLDAESAWNEARRICLRLESWIGGEGEMAFANWIGQGVQARSRQ